MWCDKCLNASVLHGTATRQFSGAKAAVLNCRYRVMDGLAKSDSWVRLAAALGNPRRSLSILGRPWDIPDGKLARATMPTALPSATPYLIVRYRATDGPSFRFDQFTGYVMIEFKGRVAFEPGFVRAEDARVAETDADGTADDG